MAGEWPIMTVDDIKARRDRSIAIGPFGSRMKADVYVPEGVPVIRGNNISDTRALVGDFVYVSEETADELRASNVFEDDLVFPHRGAIGQVAIVPSDGVERYMLSTSLMKLTCDKERVVPLFVFYFFRSSFGRHALLQHASTVGTPGIGQPLTSLRSIKLPIPPLPEQRAIAHILGTLDDKIELNRRMSATLEAMARALFKSWFVDFDPVRARAEGRDTGLPEHLAVLFPDRLVESELGEIPEGWEVRTVEDVLELAYGKALKAADRVNGPVPVYGSGGITGFHNEALVDGPSVIVGRKGTVGSLYWEDRPFFPIDTVFYVRPKVPLSFCFYHLQTLGLEAMNTDAAVPGLNRNNVYRLPVPWSGESLVAQFDKITLAYRRQIRAKETENETLKAIRDALLPKLISGELRVQDADRFLSGQ